MPKKHSVVGIDPSYTHTALYFGPGDWVSIKGGKLRGARRLSHFETCLTNELQKRNITRAIIEGYAYAAQGQKQKTGELGGILRNVLYKCGVPEEEIVEVPPSALKKHGSGRGNADKASMVKAANDKEKSNLRIVSDDIADASHLWRAGFDNSFLKAKGCLFCER